MSEHRDKIAAKVRALLRLAADSAATEAEALLAAEKADALMREYALSTKDVEEVEQDAYGTRKRPFCGGSDKRRTFHTSADCAVAVARFCDCKTWFNSDGELNFFGSEIDTGLAFYLMDTIRAAMDAEWKRSMPGLKRRYPELHGATLRASFLRGMRARINERLVAMARARRRDLETGNDRALVVRKDQIVAAKFARLGINVSTSKVGGAVFAGAYEQGRSAGDNVNLNSPVGGAQSTRAIR